jgi:hypothetical protein
MVTKPTRPNPPAAEPLRPHPTRIEPPTMVSGNVSTSLPKGSGPPFVKDPDSGKKDLANKDHSVDFKLPNKVTQDEIRDGSFRYGGGRSAANKTLAESKDKGKLTQ